jgi:uncharacterized protein (DUF305 family)
MKITIISLALVAAVAGCRDASHRANTGVTSAPSPTAMNALTTSGALPYSLDIDDRARAAEVHNQGSLLESLEAHHAQGVALARLAEERASRPALRAYAATLAATEQKALGVLGEQRERFESSTSDDDVSVPAGATGDGSSGNVVSDLAGDRSGRAEASPDAPVSGLGVVEGTGRDLGPLTALSGDEFDRVFVDAMIEHLQSGIAMAEDGSSGPVSGGSLEGLIAQEQAQVGQLEQWRTSWFQSGSRD